MAGIGWYGEDAQTNPLTFTENDPTAQDFLGQTCVAWEKSIAPVTELGKRLCIFRTGVVLSNEGGALKEFKKPLNFGMAAILGSGNQVMSWTHITDICSMFLFTLQNEKVSGVYNAVSPEPVTNRELVLSLSKKKNKFSFPMKVPAWVLKMVLGEMSIEVLKSATVSSQKITNEGFRFAFGTLESAMNDLVKK